MTWGYGPISSKGFYKKVRQRVYVGVYVTYHGMLDTEVNAFLVWIDTNLDRIVDTPSTRQGWS